MPIFDIVLLGGGSDREQMIVCRKLRKVREQFRDYVENNGVVLAVCGGYQLLGKYYKTDKKVIEGLFFVPFAASSSTRFFKSVVELAGMRQKSD